MSIGRFAPSPTGPLHFGSLVAALASFLEARSRDGSWRVRIDDLDQPRAVAGADRLILDELRRLGLHWDGPVVYQSWRTEHYRAALERLRAARWTYPCACTRRRVGGGRYPGYCRNGLAPGVSGRSVRIRAERCVAFTDRVQGPVVTDLAQVTGDFIVSRADGVPAYHLSTVIDDAVMRVDHVVRGADLLDATPAQIHLHHALGLEVPEYLHVPLATHPGGEKLSKGSGAAPTAARPAAAVLLAGLGFLGQRCADLAHGHSPARILGIATRRWSRAHIPARRWLVHRDPGPGG